MDTGIQFSNGITVSPDQTLLYVAESRSKWVWSYQVQPDGTLKHKQKYFHLHAPDTADNAWPDGLKCDTDGRLYVATNYGVQFCDQAGRVNGIIPTPNGKAANLCFGGPQVRHPLCDGLRQGLLAEGEGDGGQHVRQADPAGPAEAVRPESVRLGGPDRLQHRSISFTQTHPSRIRHD